MNPDDTIISVTSSRWYDYYVMRQPSGDYYVLSVPTGTPQDHLADYGAVNLRLPAVRKSHRVSDRALSLAAQMYIRQAIIVRD